MITIYGIKNCSTMKKTFDKFAQLGIEYHFHDFKKQTISKELVSQWIEKLGIEKVLNKKGTTWRGLTDIEKHQAQINEDIAIELLINKPSMIKRPIISNGEVLIIGFDESAIEKLSNSST